MPSTNRAEVIEPTDPSIREAEAETIRRFIEEASSHLTGRVLDFGSGKQPYRSIVEDAGGDYVPYDRMKNPGSVATTDVGPDDPLFFAEQYDAILCTQVVQYLISPRFIVDGFRVALKYGGALVMTYPTTWPQIEVVDLWRYTEAGIASLLDDFQIVRLGSRGSFDLSGFRLSIGGGVVALK